MRGRTGTWARTAVVGAVVLAAVGAVVVLGARETRPQPAPRTPHTTVPVTAEAEAALRRLERAGLPVERPRVVTRASDPDRLLGRSDGYRSKVSFEDRRVDGGLVVDNDPGSVGLGGVIEVFPDEGAARRRAEQLQREGLGFPARQERGYLAGAVLLRLSPYLADQHAAEYRRVLGARPVPPATPTPDVREV
ncbi:hypothetical protein V1J52_18530 [Streptomyces sp. TRM 70351]|uniref:hypothetical protein n=1 Tax=Streptomyces sp. TRM 70351 TaxID=3116552 RepID=UPI002E7B962B|nr:hypothetical protein [Streptomyces sp. TRM 70351]MEE1930158.1 hypothetical protein [Streptomyces sp. TRM 70351]